MRTITVYEVMHKERCVAWIDTVGRCEIFEPSFMPYSLYLEPSEDITVLVENVNNFHYWCASRVLTLDRQFAKALLNSAGLMQATTDRDRAKIALTYRCLSLTDVFWVREKGDSASFADVNLYDNHLDKTFIDIALRGKQYTVQNKYLARDLSTNGCYPKAWRRTADGFDFNRAILLMAVAEKRGGMKLSAFDVYINVIGGLKLEEPGADLPVVLAVASSYRDQPIDSDLIAIGEVGLTGEIRSVSHMNQRLSEVAQKRLNMGCVRAKNKQNRCSYKTDVRIKQMFV